MCELNILLILAVYNNKGEYVSSEQLEKYEGEALINYQSVPDKNNQVVGDFTGLQEKNNICYLNRKGFLGLFNRG